MSTTVSVEEPEAKCRIADCGCPADGFLNTWCTKTNSIMQDDSVNRFCHASMDNCEGSCKGTWCGEGRFRPVKNGAKPRAASKPQPFARLEDNTFWPIRPCDNGAVAPVDEDRDAWCDEYGQESSSSESGSGDP